MTDHGRNRYWPADAALLAGRIALAAIFILEGFAKIGAYTASQAYMQKFGVPGVLLPAVIALEIGGGAALSAGWRTSPAALSLAAFCLAAAVIFHNKLADHGQALHFWKDIGLAGGFLVLAVAGAGRWSADAFLRRP